MPEEKNLFLWVDVETTGLDEREHIPLEIACAITDERLDAACPLGRANFLIRPDVGMSWVRALMGDKVREMHTKSGLLDEVEGAYMNLAEVDAQLERWITQSLKVAPGMYDEPISSELLLIGSNVHFDRRWLRHHFPRVFKFVHRRQIDVSSFLETVRALKPEAVFPRPVLAHRANKDLERTSTEFDHYLRLFGLRGTPEITVYCEKHEYQSTRTDGLGCPYCEGRARKANEGGGHVGSMPE